MKIFLLSLFVVALPLLNAQAASFHCEYNFAGASMGTVDFNVDQNGVPADYAKAALFYSPPRDYSLSVQTPTATELYHLLLDGNIDLFIYKSEGNPYNSKLVNPTVPVGKEMMGACSFK